MKYITKATLLTALVLAVSETAFAYVGPGAGLSLLGALWGLLAAVGAAVLFLILWPLRQARKRHRAKRAAAVPTADGQAASPIDDGDQRQPVHRTGSQDAQHASR